MSILDLLKQRLAEAEDDVRRLRAAIAEIERDDAHPPAARHSPAASARPQAPPTAIAAAPASDAKDGAP